MTAPLLLLRNADVYAPEPLGRRHCGTTAHSSSIEAHTARMVSNTAWVNGSKDSAVPKLWA